MNISNLHLTNLETNVRHGRLLVSGQGARFRLGHLHSVHPPLLALLARGSAQRVVEVGGAQLGVVAGGGDVEARLFGLQDLAVGLDLHVQGDFDVVQLLVVAHELGELTVRLVILGVLLGQLLGQFDGLRLRLVLQLGMTSFVQLDLVGQVLDVDLVLCELGPVT